MTRTGSVLLLTLAACVAAAPPAKEEVFVTGWDKPVDPDGDCKFERKDGRLTITVPGKEHDLGAERGIMNAPRLLRNVEGDFTAEVRVGGKFAPSTESNSRERVPFLGAGLVLMAADKTYVRLERAAMYRDGKVLRFVNWELREKGDTVQVGRGLLPPLEDGPTYLRLRREGDKVRGAVSQDGKKWTDLETIEVKLPAKLKVGADAISTSTDEFRPEFDQFKLTQSELLEK